jgi:hypothetical protein
MVIQDSDICGIVERGSLLAISEELACVIKPMTAVWEIGCVRVDVVGKPVERDELGSCSGAVAVLRTETGIGVTDAMAGARDGAAIVVTEDAAGGTTDDVVAAINCCACGLRAGRRIPGASSSRGTGLRRDSSACIDCASTILLLAPSQAYSNNKRRRKTARSRV